jgi:undecaprenyl-diphosphatase
MEHLVTWIVALAQAHQLAAYGLSFLLSGAEALPVVGAAVPGTAIIVALGALVPSGALGFWPLVLATTAGAIAGDGFSYWLGHRYRAEIGTIWPLSGRPGLIGQGEAFFARHGGKAILVARFTPGVRAIVPLVAGVIGMPVARFYAMNALSAVLWAPSHVITGVLIGASLTVLGAIAGRLLVLVVIAFLPLALAVWLVPRAVNWLSELATRARHPLYVWASARNTLPRRQVLSLLDPARPEVPGLLALGALLVAGLWGFLGVLQDVISGDPLVRMDKAVFELLQSLRVVALDRIVVAITELGDAAVTIPVAVTVVAWLAWHRAWRAAIYGVAAVGGSAAFALLLKLTLQQSRPTALYAGWNAFAFPSSHTTVSVAFYGFLVILIACEVGIRWRIVTMLAAVLLILSIAFSRMYLGAHWLSDVAGFAFGLAWIALLGIAYLQHATQHVRAAGLASAVAITLIGASGAHVALAHGADMRRYAVQQSLRSIALTDWRQDGWTELPVQRVDLFGEYEEPFTIQWAGAVEDLGAELTAHGWMGSVPWTIRSSLEWLSPRASAGSLPVLPRLDGGRSEELVMVKAGVPLSADQRIVLRLWRSDVVLSVDSTSLPLWIGIVVEERIVSVASLVNVAREAPDIDFPLDVVHSAVPSMRVKYRFRGDRQWSGLVLLGGS